MPFNQILSIEAVHEGDVQLAEKPNPVEKPAGSVIFPSSSFQHARLLQSDKPACQHVAGLQHLVRMQSPFNELASVWVAVAGGGAWMGSDGVGVMGGVAQEACHSRSLQVSHFARRFRRRVPA